MKKGGISLGRTLMGSTGVTDSSTKLSESGDQGLVPIPDSRVAAAMADIRNAALSLFGRPLAWSGGFLVVVLIVFGVLSPYFFTRDNFIATSTYGTEVYLLALGETFVIVTAGIDLSVGAALGLSAAVAAQVMLHLGSTIHSSFLLIMVGFAAGLATGIVVGAVNGFAVTRLRIAPFLATLATLGVVTGVIDLTTNGTDVTGVPPSVSSIGNGLIGDWVPIPVLVCAVIAVILSIVLSKTKFGRYTYAIGSNAEAGRRAGIDVRKHLMHVYILSGLLSAVSGLLLVTRFDSATPTFGTNDELGAIAAVVIGGASLFGGKGSIGGSTIGTALLTVLVTGLVLLNVPAAWQVISTGLLVLVAVYVDQTLGAQRRRSVRRSSTHLLREMLRPRM
jgi:ribose transport system permease protein